MKVKTMWLYNYINQENYILIFRCYNCHFSLEIIISIDYIIKGVAIDNEPTKPTQIFINREFNCSMISVHQERYLIADKKPVWDVGKHFL